MSFDILYKFVNQRFPEMREGFVIISGEAGSGKTIVMTDLANSMPSYTNNLYLAEGRQTNNYLNGNIFCTTETIDRYWDFIAHRFHKFNPYNVCNHIFIDNYYPGVSTEFIERNIPLMLEKNRLIFLSVNCNRSSSEYRNFRDIRISRLVYMADFIINVIPEYGKEPGLYLSFKKNRYESCKDFYAKTDFQKRKILSLKEVPQNSWMTFLYNEDLYGAI